MIVFDHVSKSFGRLKAVDDLSFQVRPGHVTGFLGPNGAGKTTTLRIATHLIRPDQGTVTFDGKSYSQLDKPMSQVGVAFEPTIFHPGRKAIDHLMMLAPSAGVDRKRAQQMLDFVGLHDVGDKRVGAFSLGMRGRVDLAAAMLGDPQTLLLDEPVNGLDPEGIRWIRELLQALAAQGRTVLTSSHLLSEVEQTVDEVVIIAHGRLMYQGSLDDLESNESSHRGTLVEADDRAGLLALAQQRGWRVEEPQGSRSLALIIVGPEPGEIGRAMYEAGLAVEQLAPVGGSTGLEDIFLQLTGGTGALR